MKTDIYEPIEIRGFKPKEMERKTEFTIHSSVTSSLEVYVDYPCNNAAQNQLTDRKAAAKQTVTL